MAGISGSSTATEIPDIGVSWVGSTSDSGEPCQITPFIVGTWLVEPSCNRISRPGDEQQVEPRLIELLVQLAQRAGSVVTRRELTDAIWHTEYISDNSLTHAVAELRSVLGDDARNPEYIETIPKRGYRLMTPVRPVSTSRPGLAMAVGVWFRARARGWVAAAVTAGILLVAGVIVGTSLHWRRSQTPVTPRIVVLPFENLGSAEDGFFVVGLTEEITSRLAAVGGLQVISRTSAFAFADSELTIREIGTELGVDFVLEGSVRWERAADGRDRVRITPQLIRVEDDTQLWSATYEHHIDEVFAVQTAIGQQVVEELNIALREREQRAIAVHTSESMPAYQAYLQGGTFLASAERDDLVAAIDLFSRAIELEPGFALAHARLALAHAYMAHFGFDPSGDHAAAARSALARAEAEGGELPEVQRVHGNILYYLDQDYEAALTEFKNVLEEMPNNSDALAGIAYVNRRLGRWDRSVASLRQALQLDPMNSSYLWNMGTSLMFLHRYEEADEVLQRAAVVSPGMRLPQLIRVANLRLWDGSSERAGDALEAMSGPRDDRWLWEAYHNAVLARRFDVARELLATATVVDLAGGPVALLRCENATLAHDITAANELCGTAVALMAERVQDGPEEPQLRMWLALAQAFAGAHGEAVASAQRAMDDARGTDDAIEIAVMRENLARVYALTGRHEAAVAELKLLVESPSFVSIPELRAAPTWDPLRDEASFRKLISG